jgi:hypothetical protein
MPLHTRPLRGFHTRPLRGFSTTDESSLSNESAIYSRLTSRVFTAKHDVAPDGPRPESPLGCGVLAQVETFRMTLFRERFAD